MPDERLERLKSLLGVLHYEAEELLERQKLWGVSSYGWKDADTPDSEHAGIALWELNPPFEHDWGTLFDSHTPKYTPTKRDEILLKNGEGLIATLVFARRSLGMALCFATVSEPDVTGGNDEFWQEYATTLMWLNIATDRLRGFFWMARFGLETDKYDDRYRKEHNTRVPYSAPFKAPAEDGKLKECLEELAQLSDDMQQHRDDRREIVHKVATMTAKRNLELLRYQRRLAAKVESRSSPMFHDEELPPAIEGLKLWLYG